VTGDERARLSEIVAAHDAISPEDGERARAEVGRAADWMTLGQAGRKGGTCITPQQIESEMCWVTDT
jgi:hypothetical protein